MGWHFSFPGDLLRETVALLIQNGHVTMKTLNSRNRFDATFVITESGFKAYRESAYSRMMLASILKGIKLIYAFVAGVASTLLVDLLKHKFHW